MPYARKYRKPAKRSMSSVKSIRRRRPTAGNQKRQLVSLSKKVNQLSRVQKRRTTNVMYGITEKQTLGSISSAYVQHGLMNFTGQSGGSSWEPIFGTANVDNKNNLKLKRMSLHYWIHNNDEVSGIHSTICIMAPKTREVFTDFSTNGLVAGLDYYSGQYPSNDPLHGQVIINFKRWKVYHFRRVLTVGAIDADGTVEQASGLRIVEGKKTLNLNWTLKNLSNSSNTSWKDLDYNDLPYFMHLFMFVFSDCSPTDGDSGEIRTEGIITGSTYD